MNDQTKSIVAEKDCGTETNEFLGAATLGGAVVVGAIYEPKIPPYSGD